MSVKRIVICGDQSFFPDDVWGACLCGARICWRPHVPKDAKRVCVRCGVKSIAKDKNPKFMITAETKKDLKRRYAAN